jgi:hypothetical protein
MTSPSTPTATIRRASPGWHSTSAGFVGFGTGDPAILARWATDNPRLPLLSPITAGDLERDYPDGIKILFGGAAGAEVAEVRINGRVHPDPARRCWPWPGDVNGRRYSRAASCCSCIRRRVCVYFGLRREALLVRVEVRDLHRLPCRSRGVELGAA